jgi:hypothetical protein
VVFYASSSKRVGFFLDRFVTVSHTLAGTRCMTWVQKQLLWPHLGSLVWSLTDRSFCSFERRVNIVEENPVTRRECSTDPHAVDGPVADFNREIGIWVGHRDNVCIVFVLSSSTVERS